MPIEKSEDESNMEDLDKPTDYSDLPIQLNWNAELPANIQVPPVNIHSLVLDFSAVSFLDISALKGLQAVRRSCSFWKQIVHLIIFANLLVFLYSSSTSTMH